MATQKTRLKNQSCDVLVIGSNLSAWISAWRASKLGLKVVLVDSHDQKHYSEQARFRDSYDFFPTGEASNKLLDTLEGWLGHDIPRNPIEEAPVTVESGQLIPFVGFGDRKLSSIDDIGNLITTEFTEPDVSTNRILKFIEEDFDGSVLHQASITGVELEEGRIGHIVVNGAIRFVAKKIIYCDSPKELIQLLPEGKLGKKLTQKVARTQLWTTVGLEFKHSEPISDKNSVHVLMGNKSDFEPCLGRFFSDDQSSSIWISLIGEEEAEDTEFVGSVLRNMKRQIKRAYPEFLDKEHQEKIWVQDAEFGHLDLEDHHVEGIDNLILGSHLLRPQGHGLAPAIATGMAIEADLSAISE